MRLEIVVQREPGADVSVALPDYATAGPPVRTYAPIFRTKSARPGLPLRRVSGP